MCVQGLRTIVGGCDLLPGAGAHAGVTRKVCRILLVERFDYSWPVNIEETWPSVAWWATCGGVSARPRLHGEEASLLFRKAVASSRAATYLGAFVSIGRGAVGRKTDGESGYASSSQLHVQRKLWRFS